MHAKRETAAGELRRPEEAFAFGETIGVEGRVRALEDHFADGRALQRLEKEVIWGELPR